MRHSVSLSHLLQRINRAAVCAAVAIVFVAGIAGNLVLGMNDISATARLQARVLARNAADAVASGDRRRAAELLATLRPWPWFQAAEIRYGDGSVLARYARAPAAPGGVGEPGTWLPFRYVRQDILAPDGHAAVLYIVFGSDAVIGRTLSLALVTLVAAAVSLWVSSRLLRHLEPALLAPLESLDRTMAQVRGRSDLTVRARSSHVVEVDALARGFNEMIEQVQEGDRKLAHLAYYDRLTGLPNRAAFLERLEAEVQRAARGARRVGLLFLDLNGFKQVNDSLGHDSGDELLVQAAGRIREALRAYDSAARTGGHGTTHPARLGGDEFTVLVADLDEAGDALAVARRIGERMRAPFIIGGQSLSISASIGCAVYPDDAGDGHALLRHADAAMYEAKRSRHAPAAGNAAAQAESVAH